MRLGHAVVLGGSIAGLCSAAALARRADRVTLIERDRFPDGVAPRRGVPQSRHVHALLQRGRDEMNTLFPGFEAAMREHGVPELDYGLDQITMRRDAWACRMRTDVRALYPSRDCVDAVLRTLLAREPNVTVREGLRTTGLFGEGHPARRVRGVRVRPSDAGEGGATEVVDADLVVDATGRGSDAPAWLKSLGRTAPDEERVDARASYASRWYRQPPPSEGRWWRAAWIDAVTPDVPWGAAMFPCEGDRCVVTIISYNRAPLPATDAAFEDFLEHGLRSPVIARSLVGAEPLSPVATSRSTANQWRRWDALRRPLPGLVVTGDAACAFNPSYGQGMSVAAANARLLGDVVAGAERDDEVPRAFHVAQGKLLRAVWDMATGADVMWPQTEGKRSIAPRLMAPYLTTMFAAMREDRELLKKGLRVFHLLDDAKLLFGLDVVAKVALQAARGAVTPAAWPPREPPPELARIVEG